MASQMADTVGQNEHPPGGWGLPQRPADKVSRLIGACCFALRGVRRGGLGVCYGCPLDGSLERCS